MMRGSVLDRAGADSDAVEIEVVAGRVLMGDTASNESCIQNLLSGSRGVYGYRQLEKGGAKGEREKKNGKEMTKVQEEV